MSDSNFIARREAFRKLHRSGCFVIPNPWDPGSARYLQHLGFKAARSAIDSTEPGVLLTARAECYLVGHADPFKESIRRLQAYAEVGADVLYAPGVCQREEIQTIVTELAPKPVNILVSNNIGLKVADLADMGVRRISVGSSFAGTAWTGFIPAAELISKEGKLNRFDGNRPLAERNNFFSPAQ